MGESHQLRRAVEEDAAVVRRSAVRAFFERPLPRKQEIDTIAAWVDSGAKEGDRKDAPKPKEFYDGWNIPTPDLVIT